MCVKHEGWNVAQNKHTMELWPAAIIIIPPSAPPIHCDP